ncbi:MAG: WD40 repeat domain-containing protein [Pseudonocardiaceae bacterium]
MEWLVARAAAEQLQEGAAAGALVTRKMSTLMLDFFCDLAGHEVARRWAVDVLADPAAAEMAKQNGLAITQRLGSGAHEVLAGADLRGANLTGVRMVQGNLTDAQISGSRWDRAALLDVSGLDDLVASPELVVAVVIGRDRADAMIAPTGTVRSVAFSPDGALLALTRGHSAEIVEVASGDVLRILNGHTNYVWGVAFSPDGTLLATASADHTARLWDPATGACRATLLTLDEGGYAVLLPDGSYKLVGTPGRALWWAIKLCRFAPGELDPYYPAIRQLPAETPIPR